MTLYSSFQKRLNSIHKNALVFGTLLLTLAGLISRVIGFFYRIYLSRIFSAESIGIYQLISPIFALAFSFAISGFQTAVSKLVAMHSNTKEHPNQLLILTIGIITSLSLSTIISVYVYRYSNMLSACYLLDKRCAPLLRILALAFPMSSIHACLNGYFYGKKSAVFPAATQLFEQCLRVLTVTYLYQISLANHLECDISIAVFGIVAAETGSAIVSLLFLFYQSKKFSALKQLECEKLHISSIFRQIFTLSIPLSANHVILNLLQSIESVAIPSKLQAFGFSQSQALSSYGTLTGMALPFILFPTAITGSMAVMLLPVVSEAQSVHHNHAISLAITKSLKYCMSLGFLCTVLFLLSGKFLGRFIYDSSLAGTYLQVLGFLCPFLYVNNALSSILHGLGKTIRSFIFHFTCLSFRILFVLKGIPLFGMKAYLCALLISQVVLFSLQLISLRNYLSPSEI